MYWLRYVQRISLAETSASVYGTAVHRTIKIGYENHLGKDELTKIFKREWISLASARDVVFNSETDYMGRLTNGQEMVAEYYDKYMKKEAAPKAIELFTSRRDGILLGKYPVVAVFDQISADDAIIDYKTGVKPSKMELDLDLQFTLYSYVYRQIYGKPESGLILRHLGTMKDLPTTREEKDFEILLGEVGKVDSEISSGVFTRNLGRDCANCYFLEHCLGKERKINRWNSR